MHGVYNLDTYNKEMWGMPGGLSERIYYKMPVTVQNAIFSAYGWSLSRQRYNEYFHSHLEMLEKTQWWGLSEIEEHQNKCFVDIVKHAYATVPFYRDWYNECGVDVNGIKSLVDLNKLPVLTKKMARENQSRLISELYPEKGLIKGLTSGTTGTPLSIFKTQEGTAFQWAIWWRHKARFGIRPQDSHLTFGARVPIDQKQSSPPYWRKDYFNKRDYLSTYHISKNTAADIVKYLNDSDFKFYTGYPSAMYVLASCIDELGLEVADGPEYVVSGSDALLPKYESLISRVFGARVTEQYGMAEFAGNMSKCKEGVFHEDFECCYIERSMSGNLSSSPLIMTGWGNRAMPFIRYEVGDMGGFSQEECSCGRKSQCFSSVEGRLEDYVVTPDGRKIVGMNQVFEYAKNAKEVQIYQRTVDEVEFNIVPAEGFGDADIAALVREFERRGGASMKCKFNLVDGLQRSSSGKMKAVISEVD